MIIAESMRRLQIYYPIKFIDFENSLLKIFKRQKTTFNNLEIKNYNSLFNNNNNKQIHLTEIESKILLLLFKNNVVRKKILNKNILHQYIINYPGFVISCYY